MRQRWTESLKGVVLPPLFKTFRGRKPAYECPICGYVGPFKNKRLSRAPDVVREHAKCVGCGAVERHRLQYLVFQEILPPWGAAQKSLLHIAPEFCLQPQLSKMFAVYHTADLFRADVDFREDIQQMSFPDASYDALCVSRVLVDIPHLEPAIREIRRVLKPGGLALLAEDYPREKTVEYHGKRGDRSREIGLDALDLYGRHFSRVEPFLSSRYDPKYQLFDRMCVDGRREDGFPELVRAPGIGCMELVAVCRV